MSLWEIIGIIFCVALGTVMLDSYMDTIDEAFIVALVLVISSVIVGHCIIKIFGGLQ